MTLCVHSLRVRLVVGRSDSREVLYFATLAEAHAAGRALLANPAILSARIEVVS